jgi:putative radical SAM enzyme (TIGR03279 family)
MPSARILAVAPASPADRAGIAAGDELLTVNGEDLRDVIRYQLQTDEASIDLEYRRGGIEREITIEKGEGEPLGLELAHAVFDQIRTCDNHCPFCFIYQLPPGMRRSLYLKDDDYRLSFLYGNFTTLTRFTEADLERVLLEGLGPLYVSIHATDPDVRTRLLRNRRGALSLRWLRMLLEAGVEVHGQVVVCPGINNGTVFESTMLGVLDRFPQLASIGVVPLGVSAFNTEPDMREHTLAEAAEMVEAVERWQARFTDALGRRMVYAADEYYLMAQRPFPALAEYDEGLQHENGIGMARTFEAEVDAALRGEAIDVTGVRSGFFAWVDGAPAEGYRAPRLEPDASAHSDANPSLTGPSDANPFANVHGDRAFAALETPEPRNAAQAPRELARPVAILTGEYGARVLAPFVPDLERAAGTTVRLLPIKNRYFGGNIGVTGLLTGTDLARALADEPAGDRYLLPDVALSQGRFLDDQGVEDLPRLVEIVATDGAALVAAVKGITAPVAGSSSCSSGGAEINNFEHNHADADAVQPVSIGRR